MADKTYEIHKAAYKQATDDIRVDLAWEEAKAWMRRNDIAFGSAKPDFDKIRAAMAAAKKEMAYVARFDGQWISIEARIGSKVIEKLVEVDLSEGGDQKKWRERLVKLKASSLVTDADLKAFDAKHPDPEKVAALKKRLDEARKGLAELSLAVKRKAEELKAAETMLKGKAAEVQIIEKALKKLGG